MLLNDDNRECDPLLSNYGSINLHIGLVLWSDSTFGTRSLTQRQGQPGPGGKVSTPARRLCAV